MAGLASPIFRALAKRHAGSDAIVVLDEVPGSVDQQHLHRTVDMLQLDEVLRNQIAIEAGRPLENAFDYLTLLYDIRLTRKPEPHYDLGELNSAVRSIK